MNPLTTYPKELSGIRASGAGVRETSHCGPPAAFPTGSGRTRQPKVKRLRSFLQLLRFSIIATLCLLPGMLGLPGGAHAQNFAAQGPAPISGDISGQFKPEVGAIQSIAPHPSDSNIIYVGANNGGVWKTTDGGTNWTPLTDSQSSLSMGAMTLDLNDPSRVLAGLAIFSNSRGAGGPQNGLLFSSNAGNSWTPMGALILKNTNISSVLFRDQFILAASRDNIFTSGSAANTGLFRSLDGGKSFIPISGAGGLPAGSVTSLSWDASNINSPIYAAVQNSGIFRSNNQGQTWTNVTGSITGIGTQTSNLQVSVGAGGTVFVGVVNNINGDDRLTSVWRSSNQGNAWQNMGGLASPSAPLSQGLPGSIENNRFAGVGAQGDINLSLQADPRNANLVYIGGQSQPGPYPNSIGGPGDTGRLFRGDASKNPSDPPEGVWTPATPYLGQWLPLTDNFTSNRSSPHVDSRCMVFDANGNLLQSDDGGIYKRTLPGSSLGAWSSLNGNNLQVTEFYKIAYDGNTKTLLGAAQDNGSVIQIRNPDASYRWTEVTHGDGINVAVNDANAGYSVRYFSDQNLGNFTRQKVDLLDPTKNQTVTTNLMVGTIPLYEYDNSIPFTAPIAINQGDKTRLAFGTKRIYLAQDNVAGTLSNSLALSDISTAYFGNSVAALAYGRPGNPDLLLAGEGKNLWLSTTLQPGSLTRLTNYSSTFDVTAVCLNANSDQKFYTADGAALRDTSDQGGAWTKRISLPKLQTLEFLTHGGLNAVLAGGYGALYASRDTDLENWYSLQGNLPNAYIYSLAYHPGDDLLAVGTFGRGLFTLANASTLIPVAPGAGDPVTAGWLRLLRSATPDQTLNGGTLQTPEALTWDKNLTLQGGGGTLDTAGSNSTLSGVISGPGGFTKAGDGVLSLRGANTYEGGTIFNAGTVNVLNDANLGAASGGLTFNGGALQAGADGFASSRAVTLNPFGGIFHTGVSNYTSTLLGVLSGPGAFQVEGNGTLLLRGANTYEGGTILNRTTEGGVQYSPTLNIVSDANLGAANGTLTFNGGTLQAAAALTTSRIIAVLANGGAFNTGGFASTFSGPWFGSVSGTFNQQGGGSLTFNGDGSAFAGTYRLNSGAFSLNNNLGSTLSPCSMVVNAGSTLSGRGALVGGLDLQGDGASFLGTVMVTPDKTLSGNGALGGALNLQGGGASYGGTYTVTNGTFNLANTLGSVLNPCTVVVSPSGAMTGSGTLVGSLTDNGRINPGNSPGTLNVVGSYTQLPGGTYIAEIASLSNYDKINVTGTASLNGTLTPVLLEGYRPQANTRFTDIIKTTGGLTAAFSAVVQPAGPTLLWQPYYDATSFGLTVQRDYANPWLGLNANQQQVGYMLNGLAGTASGDLNNVLNTLDSLNSCSDVAGALQQISPDKAASLATLGFAGAGLFRQGLANRITNLRYGAMGATAGWGGLGGFNLNYSRLDGLMLAYNSSSLAGLLTAKRQAGPETRWGVYFDPGLALGSQKSTPNQTGFNFTIAGFTAGADYRVRDDLLVGLATGYSHTGAGFRGSGGGVENNTWPLTAYAAYLPESFYAYGSLGYALNLFSLERDLSFGSLSRTAKSSTTGNQFNAYAEAGYDVKANRVVVTPVASLSYSNLWVDGLTEGSAGALNLKVSPQNAASLQTGVGGKVAVPLQVGQTKVVPQVSASYQHEFANNSRGLDARLSQGGSAFTFQTDAAGRDFAVIGASVTTNLTKRVLAQVNYNAEVGRGNYTVHFLNAGLRYEF